MRVFPHPGAAPMPSPIGFPLPPGAGPVPESRWLAAACAPLSPKPAKTIRLRPWLRPATGARGPGVRLPGRGRILRGLLLIAMPHQWNGHLVLRATVGQPWVRLGPNARRQTWSAGPSWSRPVMRGRGTLPPGRRGSARCGGRHRAPAADLFVGHVAQPRRTILHGQSWGYSVAARGPGCSLPQPKASARMTPCCSPAVCLAGARAHCDFRTDLRVVYQYLYNKSTPAHRGAVPAQHRPAC